MQFPGFMHMFSGNVKGKELQTFRKQELHLSQKGLADCLGVSVRTVQGWEIGKSKPMTPIVRLMMLFKFIPAVRKFLCPAYAVSEERAGA